MDIVRKQTGENTRAVHLPAPPTPSQQPLGTPVYRTAAFSFGSSVEYRAVLNVEMPITEVAEAVMRDGLPIAQAAMMLASRSAKPEWYGP